MDIEEHYQIWTLRSITNMDIEEHYQIWTLKSKVHVLSQKEGEAIISTLLSTVSLDPRPGAWGGIKLGAIC